MAASNPLFTFNAHRWLGEGTRALDGLFDGIGGQDTENDWHFGIQGGMCHALGDLGSDIIEVWGAAADHGAQADHDVELAARGHLLGHRRDLKRPRHAIDGDIFGVDPMPCEGVHGPIDEPGGDEFIESARDNRDPFPHA